MISLAFLNSCYHYKSFKDQCQNVEFSRTIIDSYQLNLLYAAANLVNFYSFNLSTCSAVLNWVAILDNYTILFYLCQLLQERSELTLPKAY